jgi:hypothetical protein
MKKHIELQPQDAYGYLERAEVLLLMGNDEEAKKTSSAASSLIREWPQRSQTTVPR